MTKKLVKPDHMTWVSPYLIVKDVKAATDFYEKAFKFIKGDSVPSEDGTLVHAELKYKDQLLMFGKEGAYGKDTLSPATSYVESPMNLYLYCEDVDTFYAAAIAAGAKSVSEPENTFWGDRMCRLKDIDNYTWCFATYLGE